jgi:hypothetical protein
MKPTLHYEAKNIWMNKILHNADRVGKQKLFTGNNTIYHRPFKTVSTNGFTFFQLHQLHSQAELSKGWGAHRKQN